MKNTQEIPGNIKSYTNESVINTYCERNNSTVDSARKLFSKTLEFLWSCKLNNDAQSPTKEVDEMWHLFILHTKDYKNFCSEHLGKFIHHQPLPFSTGKNCTTPQNPSQKLSNCTAGGGNKCSSC